MADNTKAITDDNSKTSEWHKNRKKHQSRHTTPRTSNTGFGWGWHQPVPMDADGDYDNDTPGGVDTDNDAGGSTTST